MSAAKPKTCEHCNGNDGNGCLTCGYGIPPGPATKVIDRAYEIRDELRALSAAHRVTLTTAAVAILLGAWVDE